MKYIIVFITASSEKEARKIADGLVDMGAAACVNIVPKIKSIYIWQGKKETAEEYLLIVKTSQGKFGAVKQIVKRLHSYQTPEIISIPIIAGYKDYLGWISSVLERVEKVSRPAWKTT